MMATLTALILSLPAQEPRAQVRSYDLIATPSDCVSSIVDQANPGTCLQASSLPTLGMLYPLGQDFFVGPSGVGIGTTTPLHPLHVVGSVNSTVWMMTGFGTTTSPSYRFGQGSEETGISSPFTDTLSFVTNGVERIRLDAQGRVGIGSGFLGSRLTVQEDGVNPTAAQVLNTSTGGFTYGQLTSANGSFDTTGLQAVVTDTDGDDNVGLRGWNWSTAFPFMGPSPGAGVEGLHDGWGQGVRGDSTSGIGVLGTSDGPYGVLGVATNNEVGVQGENLMLSGTGVGVFGQTNSPDGYGVFASGGFGGTGPKYFVQPHPTDSTREIRFVCLEGNESGTYFRGTARLRRGRATIEVPEEFRLVTDGDGLTVQTTPVGRPAVLWIESQDLDRIVVRGDEDCEFHYFVNGVRRGFADLELMRANTAFVPKVRGEPYGTQYPDELRRILIENEILNPDFTPNEETAQRNGWQLREASEIRFSRPARPDRDVHLDAARPRPKTPRERR